ncbi:MAG: Gfo/Idh/MocA family oxidoreductase [Solirubrobacterales bacterium]|nr:Gfo/Idh/MocA family oxidoreductase [Solirubrobacterales bacterium]
MNQATQPAVRGVVVGLGVMGAHHLRVLRSMDGVELVAAVDIDAQRRVDAQITYQGLLAYPSLDEALAACDLDFACLAVPVGLLPELGTQALVAGLHVLVEKPTAPTEAQARALIAEADGRGLMLAVGHIERCNPAVIALKAKIDEGVIGKIIQMQARRLSPFPNRQGSQGVALDLSTHDIDVMRYITGQEVARVYAETQSPLGGSPDHEDIVCATLRFDGGAVGLLETNWMTPIKVRQMSVLGELGMLVVDYLTQELSLYQHPTRATQWDQLAAIRGGGAGDMIGFELDRREPLVVQWEQFLGALREGRQPQISGRDGLAALSTALAIRASSASKSAVVPGYREAHDVSA